MEKNKSKGVKVPKILPLADRILVRPIREDELKSKAGILLTTEVAIAEEEKAEKDTPNLDTAY